MSAPVRRLAQVRFSGQRIVRLCLAAFSDVEGGAAAWTRSPRWVQRVGGLSGAVLLAVVGLVLGCGNAAPADRAEYPTLVFPARLPEAAAAAGGANGAGPPAPALTQAKTPEPEPTAAPTLTRTPGPPSEQGDLPDPEPLVQRGQWRYTLVYDKGAIRVGQPEPLCLERARATARKIGRYAFELWVGRELVERLRFDFPLLATEEPPTGPRRPTRETPRFAPGAVVSITLRIPASERATSARILDRATGQSTLVPWPPSSGTETKVLRDCPRPVPPAQDPSGAGSEPKPTTVGR